MGGQNRQKGLILHIFGWLEDLNEHFDNRGTKLNKLKNCECSDDSRENIVDKLEWDIVINYKCVLRSY